MCSKGYKIVFQDNTSEIKKGFGTMVAIGKRTYGNNYQLKGIDGQCFVSQINEIWLWHWRMECVNCDSLIRISSR
jgi:hypothetical protein